MTKKSRATKCKECEATLTYGNKMCLGCGEIIDTLKGAVIAINSTRRSGLQRKLTIINYKIERIK